MVKKTKRRKQHEILYYLMLIILIIFISSILFLISPVLFFGNILSLYIILITIGIALGAFIKGFMKDLDELTNTHHTNTIIIILIIATMNFIAITTAFTIFTEKTIYLSILSAMVLTISFLIPYAYQYYKQK
jgi:hypothetical protein